MKPGVASRMRIGALTIILAVSTACPAFAQAPSTAPLLADIAGTLDVYSQPYLKNGKLSGCQMVFDALMQDYSYRRGEFLKVSGSVGIMYDAASGKMGSALKVVVNELPTVTDGSAVPSSPSRAYLVADDYTTNLDSLVDRSQSNTTGALFSIFQISPTIKIVTKSLELKTLVFAFNQKNGATDIRLPIDLTVEKTDASGARQRSEKMTQDFASCLLALGKM